MKVKATICYLLLEDIDIIRLLRERWCNDELSFTYYHTWGGQNLPSSRCTSWNVSLYPSLNSSLWRNLVRAQFLPNDALVLSSYWQSLLFHDCFHRKRINLSDAQYAWPMQPVLYGHQSRECPKVNAFSHGRRLRYCITLSLMGIKIHVNQPAPK